MNWNIYVQRHSCNYNCAFLYLQGKWENGTTTLWIILEFLPVVTVLAQSPDSHLESASEGKQISWQA